MFVTFLEAIRIFSGGVWSLYTLTLIYFWFVWLSKLFYARAYKPMRNNFSGPLSICIPVYKEDRDTMTRAVNAVLAATKNLTDSFEVIIVADQREPDFVDWCRETWPELRCVVAQPGKRELIEKTRWYFDHKATVFEIRS